MNQLYWYPKCSTCIKAKKYLDEHSVPYELYDLIEQTPTKQQFESMLELSKVDIEKFFNTAGKVYKELNLKEKLPTMSQDEKLELLSSNGMLVKRPLFVTQDDVVLGFKEDEYMNVRLDINVMNLGESLEDYLETILQLEKSGKIRSVDVARKMGVSKPSVNKAIHALKEKGFVTQESYGDIYLTDFGRAFAKKVLHRHLTLTGFLTDVLELDDETAEDDACKIEHVISEQTFIAIKNLYRKLGKSNQ